MVNSDMTAPEVGAAKGAHGEDPRLSVRASPAKKGAAAGLRGRRQDSSWRER